jgi:hypothetical protein
MDMSGASAIGGSNKLENLPQMVQGVMGSDPALQTECTTQFRRLLSIEKNPPIQQVIDSGVVPRFVEFLRRDDNPALQFEAAWALTNIASGTSEHVSCFFVFASLLTPSSPLHLVAYLFALIACVIFDYRSTDAFSSPLLYPSLPDARTD